MWGSYVRKSYVGSPALCRIADGKDNDLSSELSRVHGGRDPRFGLHSRKLAIARVTLQRQGLLDASRGTKFEQYQASSSTRGHHSRILKYLMCQRMSVYRASKQCAIM